MKAIGVIGLFMFMLNTDINKQEKETILFHTQYKIIDNGYFLFLFLREQKPDTLKIYSYSIDIKTNNFHVSLKENVKVNSDYNIRSYKNSEKWNTKEHNSWREKYYKIIHENFLYMTNEQKFDLLDSLALQLNKN